MLSLDGEQISIAIDLDQGARLASLQWRDMEFVTAFNGDTLRWGWYAMAPWAGRIKDGLIKDVNNKSYQLPTTFDHPFALHGLGFFSSWQDLGSGKQLLQLPPPYNGARVIQHFEILDDALRWSLEYESNGCQLPVCLGFHPLISRDIGRGGEAELSFKANKMLERDEDFKFTQKYLPQSQGPWDEIFTEVIGEPKIIWAGAAQLSIESDAQCWGVYDLSEESICIQPTTSYLPGVVGDNYLEALFRFSEDD